MPKREWRDVRAVIARLPSESFEAGGVPDAVIAAAEAKIGRFPDAYRSFVREFGWLETPDVTVYGLGETVPSYAHVVRETQAERHELEPRLGDGYIAISPDGAGNVYCVAVATDRATRVYFHDHETAQGESELEVESEDFVTWLLSRLRGEDA